MHVFPGRRSGQWWPQRHDTHRSLALRSPLGWTVSSWRSMMIPTLRLWDDPNAMAPQASGGSSCGAS
ncbi:hypothetical protein WJX84_005328 [Apatococcus fuscideae]|uniref:Uncharacterized protein n=1 Tax=Apatococcus fuscideae TaxID=2026836 RepID=A0AAW1T955_9CHLO